MAAKGERRRAETRPGGHTARWQSNLQEMATEPSLCQCVGEEVKTLTGPQGAKMRQSYISNKETAGCNRLHGVSVAPGVINTLLIHTNISFGFIANMIKLNFSAQLSVFGLHAWVNGHVWVDEDMNASRNRHTQTVASNPKMRAAFGLRFINMINRPRLQLANRHLLLQSPLLSGPQTGPRWIISFVRDMFLSEFEVIFLKRLQTETQIGAATVLNNLNNHRQTRRHICYVSIHCSFYPGDFSPFTPLCDKFFLIFNPVVL